MARPRPGHPTPMHDDDSARASLTRRRFLQLSAAAPLLAQSAPAVRGDVAARPILASGVQSGDVEADRAVVWCRTDRPARLRVRYATTDALAGARERVSAPTSADADFTARLDLTGLPPGQRIVYEARFEGANGALSEPVRGSFRTPARTAAPVRIVWGGDVCGQGWGLDESRGGMKTFASMRAVEPDLFITRATSSTPTGRSRRRSASTTARRGATSSRTASATSRRRSTSSAAATATTSATRTSAPSTPRCRWWRSGTITRS